MASAADAFDYSYILVLTGISDLQDEAVLLSDMLDADGEHAMASRVRQAFLKLVRDLEGISVTFAKDAEETIKRTEEQSRVRDDTHGAGGPRLGDWIGQSHPFTDVPGSVGVNYEPDLDANVPWWPTNEDGSSARVGDEVKGLFQPGNAPPSGAGFRDHPLFQAGRGPAMKIQNPIPDRHFVEDGFREVEARWHGQVQAARRRFMVETDRVTAQFTAARKARAKRRRP